MSQALASYPFTRRSAARWARWRTADDWDRARLRDGLSAAEVAGLVQLEANLTAAGDPRTWLRLTATAARFRPEVAATLLRGLDVHEPARRDFLRALRLDAPGVPLTAAGLAEDALHAAWKGEPLESLASASQPRRTRKDSTMPTRTKMTPLLERLATEVDARKLDLQFCVPLDTQRSIARALGMPNPQTLSVHISSLRKVRGLTLLERYRSRPATPSVPTTAAALSAPHASEAPVTLEPVAIAGEPPAGLAPEHQAVWRAWLAAGYSPTEYVGWHDKERLAVGLKTAAGKVHQAQRAWLELLGLPFPKAPDQHGAKGQAPAVQQDAAPPETVRENQAPVAEPVEPSPAPEILPDGGHIAHVPQPPTCQHCAGLGVADGCPDCGAVDKTEPESANPGSANPESVCLRCKDQAADYCTACIRAEKSELGKRFSRLASMVEGAHQVLNDLGVPTDGDGPLTLAERIRTYDRAPSIPADWAPTAANINALPDPLRRWVDHATRNQDRLESQVSDADADHRECIRLLSEAGADTSGETMALNLVQLIEERDDALAELQRLREEAETERALSQERWRTLNRYEVELMPVLLCHPNGEPGETSLADRLVTALQAMVAELEQRKPEVRVVRGLVAPPLPRLTRCETALALAVVKHTLDRTLLEDMEHCDYRPEVVLAGAAHLAPVALALEGDGGQG